MNSRFPGYWCLLWTLIAMPAIGGPRTDTVIFNNGDRLTGEVKSLQRGRLRFETDATDTISIDWADVAYLSSNQNIQVETDQGKRHLGTLSRKDASGIVVVNTLDGPVELRSSGIVLLRPIEERGINRVDAGVTAGYSFAKASEVKQLHFGLDMEIRTESRVISLFADATSSDSENSESSQRESVELQYLRLLKNRWHIGGLVLLDRNDELGLDLRTSVGAGIGRSLRQTNSTIFLLQGGLMVSRENVGGGFSNDKSVEAFGILRWDWFRYDTPEFDLSTRFKVIPNLSDTGRIRGELDVSLRWEMIEDLFWEVSLYDSYDSDPVETGAEKNDYGVNTSLGWKF